MKNKERDYTPILTIVKVFAMFVLILILKVNINVLILNFLLIICAIEILATNYRKSKIKWSILIFELYVIIFIPLQNMKSPETIFSSLLYVLIVIISIVVDFSIYIEKV